MVYRDSDGSSSESAEDPLERLMRQAEEEDLLLEQQKQLQQQQKPGLGKATQSSSVQPPTNGASKGPRSTVGDDVGDGIGDDHDEVVDKDIIAQIVAKRLSAMDRGEDGNDMRNSSHEDPLERISRIQEEEEKKADLARKREEARRQAQQKRISEPEDDEDAAGKELVKRIIAMRLAAIDDEDNDSVHTSPEDPLVRIMNMDAEDTLLSVIALTQFVEPQDENNEDDEEDVIIRNRDIFDLNTMIQKNDLEELEKRAASLAESVKNKLSVSTLADLTHENGTSVDQSGVGYFALAMGGHRDVVNHSHAMNGLDISKITNDGDEDSDRRFVSMSDSILESPSRKNKKKDNISGLLGSISSQESWQSLDEVINNVMVANHIRDLPDVEVKHIVPALNGYRKEAPLETISSPMIPKKAAIPKSGEKINGVADWWGVVGDFAGFRSAGSSGDWSDSQSSMSYPTTESVTSGSVASMDSSIQGVHVKFHHDVPKKSHVEPQPVVGKPIVKEKLVSPKASELSVLEQKRRRKRELEAWKLSIERSFDKAG